MFREPRREIIGIRVTNEEKQKIKQFCTDKGYNNVSDCIRDIIKKYFGFKN